MKKIICIVDDNELYLKTMYNFINSQTVFRECEVHVYSDSTDPRIINREYDLYFLDIDMPEVSGFELAIKIQQKYSDAIFLFVSNHNEFVYDSFKFSAFYFVRKDHFDIDMNDALRLAYEKFLKREGRYHVEIKGDRASVKFSEIMYFKKMENKLLIVTEHHGELYEVKTMKALKEEVNLKKLNFCMISAGMSVNLNCVVRLNGVNMEMKNNKKLIVSRRFLPNVKIEYKRFLMESEK